MLPNFLIIGAQKSGTTSLARYLNSHPQVFMSSTKELDFFREDLNWRLGLPWYEQQFEGAGEASAVGEASPNYSCYPLFEGVAARIAELIPKARLIYVVRHPIERMQSEYLHRAHQDLQKGRERLRVEEALIKHDYYLAKSRYALQIEHYLEYFPRKQLLVITSNELRHSRQATMQRIFGFLGVDKDWWHPELDREFHVTSRKNVTSKRSRRRRMVVALRRLPGYSAVAHIAPPSAHDLVTKVSTQRVKKKTADLPDGVRERLEVMLREDVRRLRTYLGEDFDGWGIA